jgi:hypothetical protein
LEIQRDVRHYSQQRGRERGCRGSPWQRSIHRRRAGRACGEAWRCGRLRHVQWPSREHQSEFRGGGVGEAGGRTAGTARGDRGVGSGQRGEFLFPRISRDGRRPVGDAHDGEGLRQPHLRRDRSLGGARCAGQMDTCRGGVRQADVEHETVCRRRAERVWPSHQGIRRAT